MPLHDFNDNDSTIGASGVVAGWRGLGRTLPQDNTAILVADGGAVQEEFTTYIDVTSSHEASSAPVIPRTMTPAVLPEAPKLQLPQFDFTTGVSSCTSCDTDTAAKVAAVNASVKVTPMADAPKSINWLLIAGAVGIGYYFLKGSPSGMGNPPLEPAPAPAVRDLGRPAHKPKGKLKHVASLEM